MASSENNIPHLNIPEVKLVDEHELQIERINTRSSTPELMQQLGEGLALLHEVEQEHFGFEQDNYIGLSAQKNLVSQNWGEFFVENRLGYQVGLIKDEVIKNRFNQLLNKSSAKLIDYLNMNSDQPSLVHGDLWSGNALFDDCKIWLIDPAVYYADREVDVAMTEMFGGFSQDFYRAYAATYPLSCEYQNKKVIYNLYHYLNHFNLFGSDYLSACKHGFYLMESI